MTHFEYFKANWRVMLKGAGILATASLPIGLLHPVTNALLGRRELDLAVLYSLSLVWARYGVLPIFVALIVILVIGRRRDTE